MICKISKKNISKKNCPRTRNSAAASMYIYSAKKNAGLLITQTFSCLSFIADNRYNP